jgi:hypothetical protein
VRTLLLGKEKAASTASGLPHSQIIVNYGDAEKVKRVRSLDPLNAVGYNPDGIFSFVVGKGQVSFWSFAIHR